MRRHRGRCVATQTTSDKELEDFHFSTMENFQLTLLNFKQMSLPILTLIVKNH